MISVTAVLLTFLHAFGQEDSGTKLKQTNFLLIMFDDLRPELSIYGKKGMITPNFDRLAAKSVRFDSHCQVAVCNPSRDSLLTGLRPDTIGTYGFQTGYDSYINTMIFPTKLHMSGYRTAGYGKIRHWDGPDRNIWDTQYDGGWYDYQGKEWNFMKSAVMPDKVRPEETFPDHVFTSKAIDQLKVMHNHPDGKYFMLAIGFKMPHLAMHLPYKYFDMYRNRSSMWENLTPEQLRFPEKAPPVAYRCCADTNYRYMNNEGELHANETFPLIQINDSIPIRAYKEMMWGYSAMVTFTDVQIGRLLDTIDELQLWNNLTIVLTADHGMNNGEKGIW